jgi:TonB family protein
MANDLYLQSETESRNAVSESSGHELDALMGRAFEEKSLFADLYESIRDVFFPPKLPPLELTSKPIPVPDRMKVRANPWAVGTSIVVNGAIVALLLFLGVKHIIDKKNNLDLKNAAHVEITEYVPPVASTKIGGGGGQNNHLPDPPKGHLPPRVETRSPVIPKDLIAPVPTIDLQKDIFVPEDTKLPVIGIKSGAKVTFGGAGSGMGIGSGHGNGVGNGYGGNIGGGIRQVGGRVAAPKLIYGPDPEFSDEARRAKYQGIVIVSVIVDAQGNPQNPRVVRPLGMGLDEKALEAIRKYKFKPALEDGKTPVPVMINISVDFHLY